MSTRLPRLSPEQWDFLALFEAFHQPLSIALAGELAPLAPGPFLELLRLAETSGWLAPAGPDTYGLGANLPRPLRAKLSQINSPERLDRLIKLLEQKQLQSRISTAGLSSLFRRSGQTLRAAEMEYARGLDLLKDGRLEEAARRLQNALDALALPDLEPAAENLLISATIELSNLRHHLGKSLGETPRMLQRAREAAVRQGDRRSKALIDLRLGLLSFASDNLSDALDALASGLDEVNDLGDEDIIAQGAGFAGLYYFLQGMHKDAVKYYEKAMATQGMMINPSAFFFMGLTFGFCTANLGQFHRAVGILNQHQRFFAQAGDHSLAALFESALGIVLLTMGQTRRAHQLLASAMTNSQTHGNSQALLMARIGLAHCLVLEGQMESANELMLESTKAAAESDHVIRQYIFPFILEDIYYFQRFGGLAEAFVSFETEMDRIINGPNIHLRGTAYRLQARGLLEASGDTSTVRAALETSLKYLRRAGDPIETAKTLALLAELELAAGHDHQAKDLARAAWPHLQPFGHKYFPPQLGRLVEGTRSRTPQPKTDTSLVDRFLEMLEEFVPSADLDEMLTRVVMASSRFFEAERGGLFWFSGQPADEEPGLRTSFNFRPEDGISPEFRQNLSLVVQAFKRNCPVFSQPGEIVEPSLGHPTGAVICLPVEVHGRVRGVLYHDNAYLQDAFELVDAGILQRVAKHMSVYVERLWEYSQLLQRTSPDKTNRALAANSPSSQIIGHSPAVRRLLAQADKVAASEASVLLLGETGVGKELLARRIHELSPRAGSPFVVVDVTSIPESLMESELFGHEKGAFTGADRQKPGRLELAHGGTVFLDEVGEIPLSMQAKFLRVLQEKTFTRVGGSKSLTTDFRLIAATNRDLEAAVAAGRFREDLYYRLNVIPLKIVPLRQRSTDILEMSRVFLEHFERKHNRAHLNFTKEDEARLTSYHWPGNVRELKNVIERAVLVSTTDRLELFLPSASEKMSSVDNFADLPTMDELQARYVRYVLEKSGGRMAGPEGAASILGMKRGTLYSRIKKLGLEAR